jgi:hypothetical protein
MTQEEKAIWDKYIDEIVNKVAEEQSYFGQFQKQKQ